MKAMTETDNERANMRGRKLLVDAFVALTEAGKLTDEDYFLMAEYGIAGDAEEKTFRRAGDVVEENSFDFDAMFGIDTKPLAWEKP